MKKRMRASLLALALVGGAAVPLAVATSASAHGWVTDPPSRQAYCASGETSFDCGAIDYEPQSVEAPKGSLKCSGGNDRFTILDDDSLPWPVKDVGSTVTVKWNITARHNTSQWEYFVDGKPFATFPYSGQPPAHLEQTLTGLPAGRHTILARWDVADTGNAFYSCMDVNVTDGGSTNPPGDGGGSTNPPGDGDGGTCAAAWDSQSVYTAGDEVTEGDHIWKAKWWTTGQKPGTTGEWGVWEDEGACSAGGSADET